MSVKKIVGFVGVIILGSNFCQSQASSFTQDTTNITNFINKRLEFNEKFGVQGYRLQIFSGSRSSAIKVKMKFDQSFEDKSKLVFESPHWKVRVGNYINRLDAEECLFKYRSEYAGSFILETSIEVENN